MGAVLTSNMTSNMTSKGQVTIPVAMRQSFCFKAGAAVEFFRRAFMWASGWFNTRLRCPRVVLA